MAHEASTAGTTTDTPVRGSVGRRRQLSFAAGLVATFLLVGIGLGLAGRFGMAFMIDLFDAHANPTADQYVGIVFLVNIFVLLYTGLLMSGIAGLVTGLSFRHRRTAATIAGGACFVGYLLLIVPALVIMVSILGGGGGGGGPSLPLAAFWQSAIVAAGIGAGTAVLGSTIGA